MYTFESRIRYSEADMNDRLTIESLLDYFQDCSTFHSEDLGLGVDYLRKKHLAWVLNAWQIDVDRFPNVAEYVRIGTAPYGFKGFIGYRNFLMESREGERLACASTIWTLLDLESGKPVTPPPEMKEKYICEEKLDMEYLPRKIKLPENGETRSSVMVARHHLDTNHHVNNGQYVRMALDEMPDHILARRLRVEYKNQAHLGTEIIPVYYQEEGKYIVSLNDVEQVPYAIVEITT